MGETKENTKEDYSMEEKTPDIVSDSPVFSLDSIEGKPYSTKAYVTVNDYYKKNDLRGISLRDVNKIKEVSRKTSLKFEILKEIVLGVSMAFLGALLGKLISGMQWNEAKDLFHFFISLLGFVAMTGLYLVLCTKQHYDKNKLVEALNEHLFMPLGIEEDCENE